MEHGLVVTKVRQVIQFQTKKCFQRFADQVSYDRRAGYYKIIPYVFQSRRMTSLITVTLLFTHPRIDDMSDHSSDEELADYDTNNDCMQDHDEEPMPLHRMQIKYN